MQFFKHQNLKTCLIKALRILSKTIVSHDRIRTTVHYKHKVCTKWYYINIIFI